METKVHDGEAMTANTSGEIMKSIETNTNFLFSPTLKEISLHRKNIADGGAKIIANALKCNTTLTSLSLAQNYIGDLGALDIATILRSNTTLTSLDLGGNLIQALGTIHLSAVLLSNTTLTKLILSTNPIGVTGGKALLRMLSFNSTLTCVQARGCEGLSSAFTKEVAEILKRENRYEGVYESNWLRTICSTPDGSRGLTSQRESREITSPRKTSGITTPRKNTETTIPAENTRTPIPARNTGTTIPTENTGIKIPAGNVPIMSPRGSRITILGGSSGITNPTESSGITSPRGSRGITILGESSGITNPGESSGITNPRSRRITSLGESSGIKSPGESSGITSPAESTGITNPEESSGITNPEESSGITNPGESSGITSPGSRRITSLGESSGIKSPGESSGITNPAASGITSPGESGGVSKPRGSRGILNLPKSNSLNVEISSPRGTLSLKGNVEITNGSQNNLKNYSDKPVPNIQNPTTVEPSDLGKILSLNKPKTEKHTKIELTPNDKEWAFVTTLWEKHSGPVMREKYLIDKIFQIKNETFEKGWDVACDLLSLRTKEKAFNNESWKHTITWEKGAPYYTNYREAILQRLRNFVVAELESSCKVIPLWHGTKFAYVDSICTNGLANLAITDEGYFGKGIYGTPQAEYAARVYSHKENNMGVCFLCLAIVANVFPVVDEDRNYVKGSANINNCDAHYAPVRPRDENNQNETIYFAMPAGNLNAVYDELIVFQETHIIPRFMVHFTCIDNN